LKRLSESRIAKAQARSRIVAHYAEQMNSRIVKFSVDELPKGLAPTLVTLCRAQDVNDTNLSDSAVADLVQAYRHGVGRDVTARDIAKSIVGPQQLVAAKQLLDVAIWQRQVRVDLCQPVLWNRPLLPERRDTLLELAHWLRP